MDKKTQRHILNILRQGTLSWHVRNQALVNSRELVKVDTYKNGKDKNVYHYQCAECEYWFRDYEVEVDHIEEVGSFSGNFDDYIHRMYCDVSNLQVMCISCHLRKTKGFVARKKFTRKVRDTES